MGQLVDAASQPLDDAPEATRIWRDCYVEHVSALLAERRTYRGMLQRWLEAAHIPDEPTLACRVCFLRDGHRADCPIAPTLTLLREQEATR